MRWLRVVPPGVRCAAMVTLRAPTGYVPPARGLTAPVQLVRPAALACLARPALVPTVMIEPQVVARIVTIVQRLRALRPPRRVVMIGPVETGRTAEIGRRAVRTCAGPARMPTAAATVDRVTAALVLGPAERAVVGLGQAGAT